MKTVKQKGITVIELVITMSLVVIILGVVTVTFTSYSKIINKVDMNSELQLQGEVIQRELMSILPESKGISDITYRSDTSKEISSFVANDELFLHQFFINNNQLIYQKIDKSTNKVLSERVLSTDVKSILIKPENKTELINTKKVVIAVNLVKTMGGKTSEYKIEQSIIFRNF